MDRVEMWQRAEGALLFLSGFAIFYFMKVDMAWWLALLIFFAPDLSFICYLLGARVGAFGYNSVHVYAFGGVFLAIGLVLNSGLLSALGALWLAHSGFDRMLGYGLKSTKGFHVTHLGIIGKATTDQD